MFPFKYVSFVLRVYYVLQGHYKSIVNRDPEVSYADFYLDS